MRCRSSYYWPLLAFLAVSTIGGQTVMAGQIVGIMNVSSRKHQAPWPVTRLQHPNALVTMPGHGPLFLRAIETLHHTAGPTLMVLTGYEKHLQLVRELLLPDLRQMLDRSSPHRIELLPSDDHKSAIHSAAKFVAHRFSASVPTIVFSPAHHVTHTRQIAGMLESALPDLERENSQPRLVVGAHAQEATHAAMLFGHSDQIAKLSTPPFPEDIEGQIIPRQALLVAPSRVRVTPITSFDALEHVTRIATGRGRDSRHTVFVDTTHEERYGAEAQPIVVLHGISNALVLRSGPGLFISGGEVASPARVEVHGQRDVHGQGNTQPKSNNTVVINTASLLRRIDFEHIPPVNIVETVSPSTNGIWQRIIYVKAQKAAPLLPGNIVDLNETDLY